VPYDRRNREPSDDESMPECFPYMDADRVSRVAAMRSTSPKARCAEEERLQRDAQRDNSRLACGSNRSQRARHFAIDLSSSERHKQRLAPVRDRLIAKRNGSRLRRGRADNCALATFGYQPSVLRNHQDRVDITTKLS
jgi:hypothetical protein